MIAGSGLIVFSVFSNVRNASNLEANIGQVIKGGGDVSLNEKNDLVSNTIKKSDIDQDGLFDDEEILYATDPLNRDTDGDGFLDGEEVAAGCSPISPLPNDCDLNSSAQQKLNLTDYFTFLMAGSFSLEDRDQSGPEFKKSIEVLSGEASKIKKNLLSIDESAINIEVSESDAEIAYRDYINGLGRIFEKYFSKDNEGMNIENLDGLYDELSKLKPSPNLADLHKKLLSFFLKLRIYVSNLDEKNEDPIKAYLTIENSNELLNEYEELKTEIRAIHAGPSGPVVPVNDEVLIKIEHDLHEFDSTAREKGRQALQTLSDYIINVISNMGRKGQIQEASSKFFVQNFRNFGLEGQYRGENLWRGLLYVAAYGDTQKSIPPLLCDHIKNSQAFRSLLPSKVNDLIQSGVNRRVNSLQEYLLASKCDSFVNQNYQAFMNDFGAGGGWEMFEKLSQPQNNIFGAIDLAMNELERQRQIEEQSDINEVLSGSGYLGLRECLSFGPSRQCVIWGPATIPSDLAVATLAAVINQNLAFLAEISRRDQATINSELSQIADYFSNLKTGLIPRIFGFEGF